jgi:hypothetical protein
MGDFVRHRHPTDEWTWDAGAWRHHLADEHDVELDSGYRAVEYERVHRMLVHDKVTSSVSGERTIDSILYRIEHEGYRIVALDKWGGGDG